MRIRPEALLPLLILIISIAPAAAQKKNDWPQFLGPNRNGISAETGLMSTWPEGGPRVVWRVPGGVGMGGVAISGNLALALVQHDDKQQVLAVNADNGRTVWETSISGEYSNAMGNGPRTTPTVVDKTVFAYSGEGTLTAISIDGKPLWKRNVIKDHGGKVAEYGMASSPLVVGDLVVVVAGCPKATLAAYDRKSGKPAWTYPQSDPAGYCSPSLLKIAGRSQIVSFSGSAAFGLDPRSGRAFWRYPFVTEYNCNIATPIQFESNVFLSAGENHGSVMLGIEAASDGLQVQERWKSLGRRSVLRNEWQTSILIDGHLYGFDNVGSAGPISHLTCVKAADGEKVWEQTRFGKGNLIAADGKLFISTMKGQLVVAKVSTKAYEEIGRMDLLRATRQAPALSNGRLYLRDDREIICVNVRR